MFTRILVATDGSEYSREALKMAVELAKKFNSEIELLHVITEPIPYLGSDLSSFWHQLTDEQIKEIGNKVMEMTLWGVSPENIDIIKKIVTGYPAEEILNEIRRDFDLVIMGTRGHGPLAGAVAGSVTQRVIADADCPVLVVKIG
ncbi:universal stress protein [Dehalobacter sp. DCM]|uniref:universal stress protein n=1 Tax=Dehalobacter sp. DCM TaxID=2907827 RepID=UPI00308145FB|nr:universal stress protein [Dehalobacter sp. DCM]